ncbi:MAG TPA: 2OG-Fe dioxygenase family protein [Methylophilaceae bacterium]|nr:2OG-Fe dioxygenase family protein [Methylophilaceae bacterium]
MALSEQKQIGELHALIQQQGFCFAAGSQMRGWLAGPEAIRDWAAFADSWNGMPLDLYMADGGRYRRRRYATFSAIAGIPGIRLEPHQPHYQSLDYNPLNGGIAREFEPIPGDITTGATLTSVLSFCHEVFSGLQPQAHWHIECHQFRIEAHQGESGKPTPEGVHRDGVDYVLVMMVRRVNISSGTTTMHGLDRALLGSFTLEQPLDSAIVDDRRCLHGVTPVEQIVADQPAYRDVLVVTFRNIAG